MLNNVSFQGLRVNDNYAYMEPERKKGQVSIQPGVVLRSSDVMNFSKDMEKKGFMIDTINKNVSPEKITEYLKGLNNIMPKNIKYEPPKIQEDHQYSLFTRGDRIQVWDKTDDRQIVGIRSCSYDSFGNVDYQEPKQPDTLKDILKKYIF